MIPSICECFSKEVWVHKLNEFGGLKCHQFGTVSHSPLKRLTPVFWNEILAIVPCFPYGYAFTLIKMCLILIF